MNMEKNNTTQPEEKESTEDKLYCFVETAWRNPTRCQNCIDQNQCHQLLERWEIINKMTYPEPQRNKYPYNAHIQDIILEDAEVPILANEKQ